MSDSVVTVTHDTSRKARRLKRCFVRTLFVHLRLKNVASGADILDRTDSGRRSAVIAVARSAGRRAQIASDGHRVVVHARAVLGKLICGNLVSFHVFRIRVTAGTSLSHVQRVYLGSRVAGWAKIVLAMTVDAYGDLGITFRKEISVNTGLVLAQLICAQRRIVLAHEGPIGVTAPAELGDVSALDLSAKSGTLTHGIHACLCGISSMATRTSQTFLIVNVAGKLLLGYLERGIESTVAIQTGVRRLRVSHTHPSNN